MDKLTEFFSPTKLVEIQTKIDNPVTDRYGDRDYRPQQYKKVYDKREALTKVAEMLEELKVLAKKADEIHEFCRENDIDDMMSFDSYWTDIDSMLQADPASDALAWAASNHNC